MCSSNQIKSHPDKLLKDHLFSVADLSRKIISAKKLNLDSYIDNGILEDISYLIGAGHDCGKATVYFQNYINENDEAKKAKLKNKPETHHSLISSLFTYYIVKQYLSNKNLINNKYYKYLPAIAFFVVKRHHGNLANALDEVILDDNKEEILEKQVKGIDINNVNAIYNKLLLKLDFNFDFKVIRDFILTAEPVYVYGEISRYRKKYTKDLEKEKRIIMNIDEEDTLFYYFTTLFLYSVLLDADKTDAAELKRKERKDIDKEIVDKYREIKFTDKDSNNKINRMRTQIYKEVADKVPLLSLEKDKILSLNVPTGSGKTLASLSFALKLRNRIIDEKNYNPRIVYALPFLSIIDQNFDVFEDVFLSVNGEEPTSDILLKHHHLSDIIYNTREDEFENIDKDIGKDILLIEGWNSEIIITTFMQFFYSLITNRNKAIRKFHNIANSIIILDEIQTIPHKYWLLLNKTIKFLSKCFNTYFILVTATQPLIFDEDEKEIKPLIENKEKHFKSLDRVNLMVNLNPVNVEHFEDILGKDILNNPKKDFLIVLDTVKTSKDIYDYIRKELNLQKTKLYYLSTNIIPKEILRRIKEIKIEAKRKIIVSTQLIEAGVDISVDIVCRDFGPLDSINQVAGRCNRSFENEKGLVKIFILKQENNGKRYYPHTIYESFIINKTEEIFKNRGERINEPEFLRISEDYFKAINEGKSDDISNSILKDVEKLKFDELSRFQLIEKDYYKIDVFVEADEEAKEVWHKYQDLISDRKISPFERKKEFLKIRRQFYDYVISIPERFKNKLTDFNDKTEMGYIASYDLDNLYSLETGFRRDCLDKEGTMIC